MNDLLLKYILKKTNMKQDYKQKNKPSFLNENGEGITSENELMKKLISTCEEGVDYTKV